MPTFRKPTGSWLPTKPGKPRLTSGLKAPAAMSLMKRGEVWWVDFDPSVGGEIQKRRPTVIVPLALVEQLHVKLQRFFAGTRTKSPFRAPGCSVHPSLRVRFARSAAEKTSFVCSASMRAPVVVVMRPHFPVTSSDG